ncbi:hypothetical protein THASP1DRAFT_25767 [Thamnocephalis sphaerospora]|uniref:Membrane protein BRI3 n=1 Tax=Thamnocephalis sphaerospora TaxID=78915 RepID=A0A4P9XJ93_9FUNG|nr:hypothetical protein THASP1DRAFT_25767 [Thamnocephalis sphaerospora]|eukprot:RKP05796.1 hypothetical protein THASP1DRAFT_25767 [Thamnocephalis sphaerospora]
MAHNGETTDKAYPVPPQPLPSYSTPPAAQPVYQAGYGTQPMHTQQHVAVQQVAVNPQQLCIDGLAHNWEKEYTLCGICWLIWCFPCGLLCCYLNADEKCRKCQRISRT